MRAANRFLFEKLDSIAVLPRNGRSFSMTTCRSSSSSTTGRTSDSDKARKSLKNSYLRYLRGWMMDSNSIEGAVLKGWVESRMGLPPTLPQGADSRYPCRRVHGVRNRPDQGECPHQRHQFPAGPPLRILPVRAGPEIPGPADHFPLPRDLRCQRA